jgi:putative endonuclease
MRYYTYILFSPSRYQYYIGQSHESPEYAVYQHNSGERFYTKKGAPWQLVFSKQFENSCDSYLLMQKLQNMKSRKYLKYFINHLMCVEN